MKYHVLKTFLRKGYFLNAFNDVFNVMANDWGGGGGGLKAGFSAKLMWRNVFPLLFIFFDL